MLSKAMLFAGAALAVAAPLPEGPKPYPKEGRLNSQAVAPGLCDTVQSEAGYFEIDPTTNKNYFYWAFQSRGNPATDPVVMWLTGGPGCSSLLALLTENGPCEIFSNESTPHTNPYGWNSHANMIWLDQPAGVGFSYADQSGYDSNEAEVAKDAYAFLQAYFKANPQLQKNPFFVFGESYGGHYAPAISYEISTQNAALAPGNVFINLAGVGVGNGLTTPTIQYQYYPELAYNYSIEKIGAPVITLKNYKAMTAGWPSCSQEINTCQTNTNECANAQSDCNNLMLGPYEATGRNPYDIRVPCGPYPLCYNFDSVQTWLNNATVQSALGVRNKIQWQPCNYNVNGMFSDDWMKNFNGNIAALLNNGTRVLIYAGDVDFICNWLGNQAWTLALDWTGSSGFNAAPVSNWTANGAAAGEVRNYGNFTFLRVFNAGHMVPADQPAAALTMLDNMIQGGGWYNNEA